MALGVEDVLNQSPPRKIRKGSENDQAVWRMKRHMEQRGAPRSACQEVCMVQ